MEPGMYRGASSRRRGSRLVLPAPREVQAERRHARHRPLGARRHDPGRERVLEAVEHRLDGPVVDGLDGHPCDAGGQRAGEFEGVGDEAAVAVGRQVEAVPSGQATHDIDSPDVAVPAPQTEAERSMPDHRLAGDERQRSRTRWILAPVGDDVAREAVPIGAAPARLDPWADAVEGGGQSANVDVLHGGFLHTHEYGGTRPACQYGTVWCMLFVVPQPQPPA